MKRFIWGTLLFATACLASYVVTAIVMKSNDEYVSVSCPAVKKTWRMVQGDQTTWDIEVWSFGGTYDHKAGFYIEPKPGAGMYTLIDGHEKGAKIGQVFIDANRYIIVDIGNNRVGVKWQQ